MWTIRKGVVVESSTGRFNTKEEAEKELAKRVKRNNARKARDEAYKSCGMVKVRGALGGTYWE
jgi:hypothetical protein